jgi:hypothetical protein
MQLFNRTNFVSESFAKRLLRAMADCMSDGYAHYVENRHGQRWLRVNVIPCDRSGGYTFQFLAGDGQEVGHLILQAAFHWPRDSEAAFSMLLSELYTRFEHPLITARRADSQAESESNSTGEYIPLKSRGKSLVEHLTIAALGAAGGAVFSVFRDLTGIFA